MKNRPDRNEKHSKGRPQRRATRTHLIKYQLYENPKAVEQNDLKRALQESLEEQSISKSAKNNESSKSNDGNKSKTSAADNSRKSIKAKINSDTSSSGNSSSSVSLGSSAGDFVRRTRSGVTNSTIQDVNLKQEPETRRSKEHLSKLPKEDNQQAQLATKRVKLTNGTQQRAVNSSNNSSNNTSARNNNINSCDNNSRTKVIKTYSKQEQINGPRSSTPIDTSSDRSSTSMAVSTTTATPKKSTRIDYSSQGTQTSPPADNRSVGSTTIATMQKSASVMSLKSAKESIASHSKTSSAPTTPREQFLKPKRESKSDAYAKISQMNVYLSYPHARNTSAMTTASATASTTSSAKKHSPNCCSGTTKHTTSLTSNGHSSASKISPKVNSNSSTNNLKNATSNSKTHNSNKNHTQLTNTKTKSNSSTTSTISLSSLHETTTFVMKHPTIRLPSGQQLLLISTPSTFISSLGSTTTTATNVIPTTSIITSTDPQAPSAAASLSNIELITPCNQDPSPAPPIMVTEMNGHSEQTTQSSWSLLGVPEEKLVYLRNDEPPKRLICYPAIKHIEGDVIQVRDSVLLRSGAKNTDLPYIAKVCAFWRDATTGSILMSLFWYYRPEHTEDGRKPHHLIDEIFASRHRDVDSVECIEDKCYVLTFNEYCRYKKRCKMDQVRTTWSLADVTIPVSNEVYPRRNRIPDSDVNPELVFCCRQIYDSRMKRLIKNPLINSKYGHI